MVCYYKRQAEAVERGRQPKSRSTYTPTTPNQKRPKEMTDVELRAHNSMMRRAQRNARSPQKKTAEKMKRRRIYRESKDAELGQKLLEKQHKAKNRLPKKADNLNHEACSAGLKQLEMEVDHKNIILLKEVIESPENMGVMTKDKEAACKEISSESKKLRELSMDIWENPELCFQEHHAHKIITDFLEEKGFQVERKYKLDTAFRATAISNGATTDSPHIGVMCEYDALPGIGHACGHNLIAIMGVSISLGIKAAFEKAGIKGKLTVLGCPAEEGGGGKIDLIQAGAFKDLDLAMMAHPAQYNLPKPVYVAMSKVDVQFEGLTSHAAAFPWDGVNALDAAVLCYQNVSCMRQQMKPTWRVHGVFTKGGEQPSIIPAEAAMQYYFRTPTTKDLKLLKEKLINCFEGAALSTGCKVNYTFSPKSYNSLISNEVMASLYEKNGESVGIEFEKDMETKLKQGGSTDMGNVSCILPSLHPKYSLNTTVALHTTTFRDIAKTEASHEITLQHAKALAMSAIDVYNDPSLIPKAREGFNSQMANAS